MRLKFLNLPSLQRRRERYIIINTWKILHKKAPNDIKMVFYESDRLGVRAKVPPEQKIAPLPLAPFMRSLSRSKPLSCGTFFLSLSTQLRTSTL